MPAHVNAPISKTDPERNKLTMQQQRLRCYKFERELNEMRSELQKSSIEVLHELINDFAKLFYSAHNEIIRFMSLFWHLSPNQGGAYWIFPKYFFFCICVSLSKV